MSRISKVALCVIAVPVALLVLLAAILLMLVGTDVYKTRLESTASRALGMELSFAGRPGIHVFPGLVLTLDDVHVRQRGAEVATAKQVKVGIELLSLLSDELRIGRIALTQPRITIERGRDGRFNLEAPTEVATALPAQVWPEVSVSDGTVVFVDRRYGKGFEARGCGGEVHRLQSAGGQRADFLRAISFRADLGCAQIRKEELTLLGVKFVADAKNGIIELKPFSTQLFGTQGAGTLHADFSGAAASYQISYTLMQFPIEEFFGAMSLHALATGRMDFVATLSTRGTTLKELKQAMSGQVSLRGKDLTFTGTDLDEAFDRFESSQTFSLVDVGAVFFAGPAGLLITKGFDYAKLSQGSGGSSEIRTLVSEWKVERGVAQALDVAMATRANRIALRGGLDFVNERFDDVSVALVDAKGCVKVQQRIRGSFQQPVVEKPNLIEALAGPAVRLLKKGSDLVFGKHCEVFYAGTVAGPQ
jgi:AsmA family/AsmA-like C-terminal region